MSNIAFNYDGKINSFRCSNVTSLRKHSFLLALRCWGRFARRNVCDSATEIPYWCRKICPESGQKNWPVDGVVTLFKLLFTNDRQKAKGLYYEQSLFFLGPSGKTPETRKWPRAWLKARGRGGARPLPLLNLEKKRDCAQSTKGHRGQM